MKAAVFYFSKQGGALAERLSNILELEGYACETVEPHNAAEKTGEAFRECNALIYVGACGIAVRKIAPYIQNKTADPAVIAADDRGSYVIPILSGHIGGANALAKKLAAKIGAAAVITTATDINGRFSVDEWAARNNCHISDMTLAKEISAGILEGDIPFFSDFQIKGGLWGGLTNAGKVETGIALSYRNIKPFGKTLLLVPRVITLGIGCHKGIKTEEIERAVKLAADDNGISEYAFENIASIDLKAKEEGLLEFARKRGLPLTFYGAEELQSAEGEFSASEYVKSITGVDNVCERAAALKSGGQLIVRKQALGGVTVAMALRNYVAKL